MLEGERMNVAAKQRDKQAPPYTPPWPYEEDAPESDKPERGSNAVQHDGETRGRRSKLFPDLNITATAAKLGVTKSHLAKILSGANRPSLTLAKKLADALQKDLTFVVALSDNSFRQQDDGNGRKPKPKTGRAKARKKKASK